MEPLEPCHFDDMLVEYKNAPASALPPELRPVTRSRFQVLLCAIEKAVPHFKGHLCAAHAVSSAWKVSLAVSHSVPMEPGWGLTLGCNLLETGAPGAGLVLIVQSLAGLRPGEGLGLQCQHMVLPAEAISAAGAGVILLGMKKGTKAKRCQFVVTTDPFLLAVMEGVRHAFPFDSYLWSSQSLAGYNAMLRRGMTNLNLQDTRWSAHSPRPGFATAAYLRGVPAEKIQQVCRWSSVKMLKVYLDAQAVTASSLARQLASKQELLRYAETRLPPLLSSYLGVEIPSPACSPSWPRL